MQYLLTEEEYNQLQVKVIDAAALLRRLPSISALQKICTKAADEWPIKYWGRKEAEPWHCMITAEKEGYEHYCDECPVQNICPYDGKSYSK